MPVMYHSIFLLAKSKALTSKVYCKIKSMACVEGVEGVTRKSFDRVECHLSIILDLGSLSNSKTIQVSLKAAIPLPGLNMRLP